LTRSAKKRLKADDENKVKTKDQNLRRKAGQQSNSLDDMIEGCAEEMTELQPVVLSQTRNRRGRPPLRRLDESTGVSNKKDVKQQGRKLRSHDKLTLCDLNEDVLEHIVGFLDVQSALSLFSTCKTINKRLTSACGFWYQLCLKEKFNDYHALKQSDEEESCNKDESSTGQTERSMSPPAKKKRRSRQNWVYKTLEEDVKSKSNPRTSFTGDRLHCVTIPSKASYWRKVWLRGLQMRRNVCQGRFEMWRLFMTDKDHLPVKKMTAKTTHRELRSAHRSSKYNTRERQVRISRYWTEEYMIVMQYNEDSAINDLFVWEWDECQNPKFKFVHSLFNLYPDGLSPMSFFLWKQYLVLAPNVGGSGGGVDGGGGYPRLLPGDGRTPLIRVHDLSDSQLPLVAGCDLPQTNSVLNGRLHELADTTGDEDTTHLHKMGEFAVRLVRSPEFRLFVFSLPDAKLVRDLRLSFQNVPRPLEEFRLEQRYLTRKNVMYFIFSQPEMAYWNPALDICTGALVQLDFDTFLTAAETHAAGSARIGAGNVRPGTCMTEGITARLCDGFCFNRYPVEKIALIGANSMACLSPNGSINLIELVAERSPASGSGEKSCSGSGTLKVRLKDVIPSPGKIMNSRQFDFNVVIDDDDDFEEPSIVTARDGEQILVLRHFADNHRRIHAYETSEGKELFNIDLDAYLHIPTPGDFFGSFSGPLLPSIGGPLPFKLSKKSNCLSVDLDGNFLCVSDTTSVVIWNSKSGKFIRQITIPKHYQTREDDPEAPWQGHTDFAFAEDGLVIVHNKRNFPIAADILLFW